jgi:excisionase family DNA binding protein
MSTIVTEVMTTIEAAEYVGLKKPTMERFRFLGQGPAYCKLGGAVRYRKKDLDEWLDSRLVSSVEEARNK